MRASPSSDFDWGLNLPDNPVSRRVAKNLKFQGPNPFVLAEMNGPGCIRRFWVTGNNIGRDVILRIYFDGASVPNVEAPLPDFFGVMHNLASPGKPYIINTPFIDVKPKNGLTCFFPMPFAKSARFEVVGSTENTNLYYMIDWHDYPNQELKEPMRFCARWRREAPVRDFQDEFIMLDADGPGRLVGFTYGVDMLQDRFKMRWSHAGADNIYLDGGSDQPGFLRGIGGEDTFGSSYGGGDYKPQSALFADMPYYIQKDEHRGDPLRDMQKLAAYRFYLHEAICFKDSIHMRFAARAHDITSTVYWYSTKPVRPFYNMPPIENRLPGSEVRRGEYDLALPDYGQWWIVGPLPISFNQALPASANLDTSQPYHGHAWQKFSAIRGFVEFNHVLRPPPNNDNSVTLDGVAVAHCTLESPSATTAKLTFAWDDELVLQVNDDAPVNLGTQAYFLPRVIGVTLVKGKNTITVRLSNTVGLTRGAWNFSFRCFTGSGLSLLPMATN